MRRWPAAGLALAGLWLFVNGVQPTVDSLVGGVLGGFAVGMPVAYVLRRFYTPTLDVEGSLRTVPAAVVYTVLFLWELLTANLDVAYRTLSPSMPIEPDVVEIPLRVQSDLAITTIANSITLTPGTLTMDYDEDRNVLYVHGITGADQRTVIEPIRRWEDYALVIFDEDLKPRDPVPNPDADRDRERRDPSGSQGEAGRANGEAAGPDTGGDRDGE